MAATDARPVDTFAWRKAIACAAGPDHPQVRHVLLTLSLFMGRGKNRAFPSQQTLAAATALDARVVRRHLRSAEAAGWVIRREQRRPGGLNWRMTEYLAAVPAGFHHTGIPAGGEDTVSAPSTPKGEDRNDRGCGQSVQRVRTGCPPNLLREPNKNLDARERDGRTRVQELAKDPEWLPLLREGSQRGLRIPFDFESPAEYRRFLDSIRSRGAA